MKRLFLLTSTLFIVLCSISSVLQIARGQERRGVTKENYVPHEVLVRFKSLVGDNEKSAVRKALKAEKSKFIKSIQVEFWKLPEETTTEEALKFLGETSCIESAEPNYLYKPQIIPNDQFFNHLWYLKNDGQIVNGITGIPGVDIRATQAWDIETGSADIIIAVIDSGIDFEHPDLINNVWINNGEIPDNGIDDDNNGYIDDVHGWNFANNDNIPFDYSTDVYGDGHGTHVAGIIAAQGDNGIGTTGIMWSSSIMPVQVFDLFQTSPFLGAIIQQLNIVLAMEYAVDNGAKIINCSFGSLEYSQYQYDAINYANQNDVLVVCAAGNGDIDSMGDDNDLMPFYPASYNLPNIISVAATNEYDQLSSYSNYGLQSVDVAAPGGGNIPSIYSTMPIARRFFMFSDISWKFEENEYGYKSGTSMATPLVSGLAGLIWSSNPSLTHLEIKNIILNSVDKLPSLDGKIHSGGRINAYESLSCNNCCANYDSVGGILNVPCLILEQSSYWLKLKLINILPVQLQIIDYGENEANCNTNCGSYDPFTNMVHIPCFKFGGTTYSFGLNMVDSENLIFNLNNGNQQ